MEAATPSAPADVPVVYQGPDAAQDPACELLTTDRVRAYTGQLVKMELDQLPNKHDDGWTAHCIAFGWRTNPAAQLADDSVDIALYCDDPRFPIHADPKGYQQGFGNINPGEGTVAVPDSAPGAQSPKNTPAIVFALSPSGTCLVVATGITQSSRTALPQLVKSIVSAVDQLPATPYSD